MSSPHVDIVIVNYNGRHNLEYSLPSLVGQKYPNFHIYVADNASTDGTVQWLRKTHPTVHAIQLPKNIGMAAMNSVLTWPAENVHGCHAKYVFVAGWDLVFDPRCIEHAVRVMESHPDVGILGFRVLGLFEWVDRAELELESAKLGELTIEGTTWVPGACSFIRREVLDVVGFLDPEYFAYAEEDDLQYRFRAAGFSTVLINTPVWQNVREASIKLDRAAFLAMRNQIRFAFKNRGFASGLRQMAATARTACSPFLRLNTGIRVNQRLRPYSPLRNIAFVARAYLWNVAKLPATYRARAQMLRSVNEARRLLRTL